MSLEKSAGFIAAGMALTVAANLALFQPERRGAVVERSALAQENALSSGARDGMVQPVARVSPATADAPALLNAAVVTGSADDTPATADVVRGIQRELNARGYDAGTADGVTGLVTKAAILAFEQDYGLETLTATPSADLLSRIVLGSSVAQTAHGQSAPRLTPGAEAIVRTVKSYLAARGYRAGPVDGAITPALTSAIRAFEVDQKLPESGRISGPLMSRLMRLQTQPVTAPGLEARAPAKPARVETGTTSQRAAKTPPTSRAQNR